MQLPSIKRIFIKLRPVLRWFFRLRGSPEAVAGGFGLGIFIALTPTVGAQVLLALTLATLLKLNRVAAVVPVWITNPVTIPPLFTFNYWLGSLIWPGPGVGDVYRRMLKTSANMATLDIWEIRAQIEAFVLLGKEIFIPLVIGSILAGGCAGCFGYFTLLRLFAWFSMRREMKRRKRLYR
jgi:uncharacterized protein (DUF2062 family)